MLSCLLKSPLGCLIGVLINVQKKMFNTLSNLFLSQSPIAQHLGPSFQSLSRALFIDFSALHTVSDLSASSIDSAPRWCHDFIYSFIDLSSSFCATRHPDFCDYRNWLLTGLPTLPLALFQLVVSLGTSIIF